MASAPEQFANFALTIRYSEQRVTLYVTKTDKVSTIIQKAADSLKERPEGLQILYQGMPIPDDATVADALQAKVTVIHLVRRTERKGPNTRELINLGVNKPKEKLHAFCRDCQGLVLARPIFICRDCKAEGKFERKSAAPIDYHAVTIAPHLLVGMCAGCEKEHAQPLVTFECCSCDQRPVAPLRLIRDNIHDVPCMKCGLRKDQVVIFTCSSQHCMCLDCFSNMCKQQLGVGTFQPFEGLGYSIGCPGPGDDCKTSPILDPHHFCVVDNAGPFYNKFKELSLEKYQPSGDNILCKCTTEIDLSHGKEVPVEPPPTDVTVSGLRWYQRLFRSQPKRPPSKGRRRASCGKCDLMYCVECKQVWHEGACVPVTKEMEEQEQAYPIDPAKAHDGRWPTKEE